MNDSIHETKLYYEAHVTIEPVFDQRLAIATAIGLKYNFHMAKLLMQKDRKATPEHSDKDSFMTSHSKTLHDIHVRLENCIEELKANGFQVWRYKVEETVVDSKYHDQWRLLA